MHMHKPAVQYRRPHGERRFPLSAASICWRVVRCIGLGYVLLVLVMAGCQRSMIYYPKRNSASVLRKRAADRGLEAWTDGDGTLTGWKTPAPSHSEAVPAVVVFHGNAGHALHRTYFAKGFQDQGTRAPWQTHLFEYPGYGAREGRPSESAILAAAESAVKPLLNRDKNAPVFLVGESLGSGVACHLAGQYPDKVAGLLLITPFPSLPAVGRHHYPFLPVDLLLRDRFDNQRALRDYNGPVAFVVAEQDRVVPPELGISLHEAYTGPKQLWRLGESGHNTISYHPDAPWWTEAINFLNPEPRE